MNEAPIGWASAKLKDVIELRTGPFGSSLHQSDYVEGGVPLVNPMHIADGRIQPSTKHTVSEATAKRLSEFRLQVGDVILGRRGEMGRCAVVQDSQAGWLCGTGSLIVRPRDCVVPGFLQRFLSSDAVVTYLIGRSVGSTMVNLNQQILLDLDLVVPPRKEQARIVEKLEELLSDLDAGVAELKAAQRKLAQYRQSLLKAAVEGALTADWRAARGESEETGTELLQRILAERRAHWEQRQLAKLAEQGRMPPKGWQAKYPEPISPDLTNLPPLPTNWGWASIEQLSASVRNGLSQKPAQEPIGYPILRINAVRAMSVDLDEVRYLDISRESAEAYLLENGDLLATRYNGSVDLLGVVGVVRGLNRHTVHPDKLIRIQPVLSAYLADWIEIAASTGASRAHIVSRVKTTAGQTGISGDDLKRMPVPLPALAEQAEITSTVRAAIEGIAVQQQVIDKSLIQAAAQRKNLLKAAFAGQLVPQDPADEPASELLARTRAARPMNAQGRRPTSRARKAR